MAGIIEGFEDKRLRYWGLGLVLLYAAYIYLRGYLFTGYHGDVADNAQFFNWLLEIPIFIFILVVVYFSITRLGLCAEDWGLSFDDSLYSMCGFILLAIIYWFFDDPAYSVLDMANTDLLITIYMIGTTMFLTAILISILVKIFSHRKEDMWKVIGISAIVYYAAMSSYNVDFKLSFAAAILVALMYYLSRSVLINLFFAAGYIGFTLYSGVFVLLIYFSLALMVRLLERRAGTLPAVAES